MTLSPPNERLQGAENASAAGPTGHEPPFLDVSLRLYRSMCCARAIDEMERELIARGEAFFHVSGAGHEATAALATYLHDGDFLHCHYRDKALLIARGVPAGAFFDNLLCNADSQSAGRQMSAHVSAPALNVLSIVGPVGNNALQAVGVAHEIKERVNRPIVLCSLGDGMSQQGEVLEAIAEAVRWRLPVLFLVEDNSYAISTRTGGKTFYSTPDGDLDTFYGLAIQRVDGSDPIACDEVFGALVGAMRDTRGPALCVMKAARLSDHTNADDETVYRTADELRHIRATADPLATMRAWLLGTGVGEDRIAALERAVAVETRAAAEQALEHDAPRAMLDAKAPLGEELTGREHERRGMEGDASIPMAAALRTCLAVNMRGDPRITLYGEDIEDPKGDVFGLTRGLGDEFPGRVANSPLSEATIMGVSIGRALAGGRPVAFIQFADFLPLGFNQLACELASLHWRTKGEWRAPMVVLASCGAFRPGLGPFHAGSAEALAAHVPGLDVALPSTAADAAGILNAAFRSQRPTVVLYPKALLNDTKRGGPADVADQFVPVGTARRIREGGALTLVAWGNTVPLCERVAETLAEAGVGADVIDLRWISPWDTEMVCRSVRKTGRLLVVHEDNLTAGFGAEVIAAVAEQVEGSINARRIARPDTFVPCHFGNQLEVLPSYRSILTAAAEMCDLDIAWEAAPGAVGGRLVVETIGSSPADQTVEVVELLVKRGDTVAAGQTIASLEADKAVIEIASPADGVVEEIHLQPGEHGDVGAPLITLAVSRQRRRQPVHEEPGTARLTRRAMVAPQPQSPPRSGDRSTIAMTGLAAVEGRGRLENGDLIARLPTLAANGSDGLFQRTGIESRLVADSSQTVVSMAAEAAREALAQAGIGANALSLVIGCTSTPEMIAPSTACRVLHELDPAAEVAAYDLQAACSGYLYALTAAFDHLQARPDGAVLVLTSELMRRIVDIGDPATSPIFGDASTATVLTGDAAMVRPLAVFRRPFVSARGETGKTLQVPLPGPDAHVRMDGKRIFSEGVRRMDGALREACARSGLAIGDLDLIVPHQANGRIIEALRSRLHLPAERVWNEIRFRGNTSSSSVPLALATILRQPHPPRRIGVCVFGAGYTFGGAICETAP
jgi:2-oxoisovalerate dehydrogenase E1 component